MRDWEHYYQLEQAIRAIGDLLLGWAAHLDTYYPNGDLP